MTRPKHYCKTGKKRYRSKDDADWAKKFISLDRGDDPDMYSYQCEHCKGWHHGGLYRRLEKERFTLTPEIQR